MSDGETIRIVLAGCGGMSNAWLDTALALPGVEVIGLVDIIEAATRKKADAYHLEAAVLGTDLQTVLEQTRPDAVFNCTIPEAHFEVTMEALRQGCHVLSEKPLADSMEHARAMVAEAERVGKIFAVIQNRRYDANIRRLRQFLASDTLGPLTTVNSDFYIGAHFGGFRDHMRHVLLLDMAIHTFDQARYISGADPVAVYCREWNPSGSWYDHDASAIATFEMSNGLLYTYRGSWCANGLPTSWNGDWRIVCQNGSVAWDGETGYRAQLATEPIGFHATYQDLSLPPYEADDKTRGHFSLIQEFVTCIRTGTVPDTVGSDNIKSLAMVFGAIESAERGQRVLIEL